MRNGADDSVEKLFCNDCSQETYHDLLHRKTHIEDEPIGDGVLTVTWKVVNELFECRGCTAVLLRRTSGYEEVENYSERYFPPRASRRPPEWIKDTPRGVKALLEEVYNSLDANNRSLPLMGARAVLDVLIADKVGDDGTFAKRLEKLEQAGYVSKKNREVLAAALDAGHAASHRGYAPPLEQIEIVMDIVENLVQSIYMLEDAAAKLKKAVPARSKKSKP